MRRKTKRQTKMQKPYPQVETYVFGQLVESVDSAWVTNRFEYDALDRRVATIDGRNNRTVYAYDEKNNLVSTTDAVGAVTAYGYDVMGQTVTVTNALGNVTRYEYDLRGNKTYEGGATYPVRYTYDLFGNKTSMTTYRNEASGIGDTTTWTYDEASGVLLSKTYADGKGLTYTYTNDGKLATRMNARGIVTTYAYDAWGQLLSIDYADTTPDIAYTYDAMGRQTSATDAVGTTTFTYDAFGQLTAEQVSGLYTKTLTRHYDTFGRNVGYSVDGDRKQSIVYNVVTGRIAESDGFKWEYLPGSHLKSSLTYPNDAVVTWSYEPHRDLLTAVTNATYSTYTYTNDLLGRRTSKNDEQYSYNIRDELIAADDVAYAYDDIGNRTTAEGKTYTANNLNQYTAIDDFTPQYDADGNQTLIKTSTGIWAVTHNAENRPIRWQSGDTVITMAFDRMGRRVEMRTVKDGEETLQRFVYDNYLCVQQLRTPSNTLFHSYLWDPTEPIATRPLAFLPASGILSYYLHDGNKNVSDLVDIQEKIVHYDYTPFGSPIASVSSENPFCFSSEQYHVDLGCSYYNYRHYNPWNGRWTGRDPLGEVYLNLYDFIGNSPSNETDFLGLACCGETPYNSSKECCVNNREIIKKVNTCVAEIHLGHFGGRTQKEQRKECKDWLEQQYQKSREDSRYATRAYITCFAKTTNTNRQNNGETITPDYSGKRRPDVTYPFPPQGIPPEQHVNTALENEIKNAIRRLAELKNAGCCNNVEIKFLPLSSSGDDRSVDDWFRHPTNQKRMADAKADLNRRVRAEQNKLRKSK